MLVHNKNFDIKQIADSGQCFRMNRIRPQEADGQISYGLIAYGRYIEITQFDEETVEISCSEEEYHQIWEEYFDLNYDYGKIIEDINSGEDSFLKQAAAYGKGIRILKQEPFEAAISFIISQNKNIPAIRSCIEALCSRYGERKTSGGRQEIVYYCFPSPEILAEADIKELRALKTGYRDEYIIHAAQAVRNGSICFDSLQRLGYEESVKSLKSIRGIGEKVANCISLYGLHHIEGFPVDVWISRVLKEFYNGSFPKERYYGYAGILQQYMFYYMRYLKGIS
jgi:N-glycosylase/DNA lyase